MMIIAHRGASGYAPENTLSAFKLAVEMGAKNFEFDVHLTKDGKLVVCHDYDLKRSAGVKTAIAEMTYAELKKADVGGASGRPFERVPLLSEVIEALYPPAEWINFELKNDGNVYPGIEKKLVEFLSSRRGLREKSVLSSFDYEALKRLRGLDVGARLGYLAPGLTAALLLPAIARAKAVGAGSFHINLRLAYKFNIAMVHKAGMKVFVYTVNKRRDAVKMRLAGADGIFSDYPDVLTR